MHRGKDAAAGHQFISVRARRSAIEEETNFHEQHRSPEPDGAGADGGVITDALSCAGAALSN
jgi:hypothetical protein